MRALVVDDSRAMRLILKQILQELSFDVVEAAHGLEALERLRQVGCVELALVDWNMPQMKGIDLVRAVRAQQELAAMKIMMVTTETEMEQVQCALGAGRFFLAELHFPEVGVDAVVRQQLGVRANFRDVAAVHDYDAVGAFDGGEPVRDHERRAAFHQGVQRGLHGALALGVQSRSGLVED